MPRRNRILVEIDADSRRAQRELRRAEFQVRRFGRNVARHATGVGIAFGGAAAAATTLATNYETQFAKIQGLVGVAEDDIKRLQTATLGLAETTGRGPRELADALFLATSAGFGAAEALQVTEIAGKAAAAGLGIASEVTDALTASITAYGQEALSAAAAGDILARTVEQGRLDASALATQIGPLAGLAASVGVEFHELGASFAALSRVTSAQGAATQIRGILTALIRPTVQAQKALEAAGSSAEQFRDAVAEGGLLPALEQLIQLGIPLETVFANTEALAGALQLTGPSAEANRQIFAALEASTGKLDQAFNAVADTTEFEVRNQLARLEAEAIQLGQRALPLAADAASVLGTVASRSAVAIAELPPALQAITASVGIGGIAALVAGPRIAGGIRSLRSVHSALGTIATTGTGARAALAGLGSTLTGPVGLGLAASVAAIGVGWALIADNVRKAREQTERFNDIIGGANPATRALEAIEQQLRTAAQGQQVSPATEALLPLFGPTDRGRIPATRQRLDETLRQSLAELLPTNIPEELLPQVLRAATQATRPGFGAAGLRFLDPVQRIGGQATQAGFGAPTRPAIEAVSAIERQAEFVFGNLSEALSEAGLNGTELTNQIIEIGIAAAQSAESTEQLARETLLATDVRAALVDEFGEQYVETLLRQAEVTNDYSAAAAILDERMRGAEASTNAASEAIEGLGLTDTVTEAQNLLADSEISLALAANTATEAISRTTEALFNLASPIAAGFGRPGAEINLRQSLGRLETAVSDELANEIPALLETTLAQAGNLLEAVPDIAQRRGIFVSLIGRIRQAATEGGFSPQEITRITELLATPAGFNLQTGSDLSRLSGNLADYPLPAIFDQVVNTVAATAPTGPTAPPITNQTFIVEAGADVITRSQELNDLARDEGRVRP